MQTNRQLRVELRALETMIEEATDDVAELVSALAAAPGDEPDPETIFSIRTRLTNAQSMLLQIERS